MPSSSSFDQGSWVCQDCQRHVPPRVVSCRCGAARPVSDAPLAAEPPAAARSLALVVIGLVLGAAVGVPAWSHLHRTPAPSSTAAPIATTLAEPVAEAPAAVAVSEAVAAHGEGREEGDPIAATAPVAPVLMPAPVPTPAPVLAAAADVSSLEDVAARVIPAVASIQAGSGRGSGFFVRTDTVVTNAHVVEGHSTVTLQTTTGSFTARVTTMSKASDLAVLHVLDARGTQAVVPMASGAGVRVGQEVIAVGSALGVLSNTVTRGIVSAVRQVGRVQLVQTDAAINPGNSGGPLVDRQGRVIGVNSMTVARHAGQGVAFAVAIEHAARLLAGGPSDDDGDPRAGVQQMFTKPAEPEDPRAIAEQAYAQVLEAAARRADELDALWARYEQVCVTAASTSGGRAWFAVYETPGVSINPRAPVDCASWLDAVRTNAAPVRAAIEQANEAGRRSGAYPGVMRDMRSRFRLTWAGWN